MTAVPGPRLSTVWPLADQAVVSLGSFLTSVSLARVLSEREYGTFAFLVDLLLLLVNFHGALTTYALSVRGATSDAATLRALTGRALGGTIVLAAPLIAMLAGAAFFVEAPQVSGWASAALVWWTVQETLRRALMAHLRHDVAIWGDAVSYLGQATVIWVFRASISLEAALTVMAATSLLGALLQAAQLRLRPAHLHVRWADVWPFFAFGRWALLVAFTSMITVQAFGWSMVFFHGTAAFAGLQSVSNLVRMSHPVMLSTANVLVPAVAAARLRGPAAVWPVTLRQAAPGAAVLVPYFLVLFMFPEAMLRLLYGGESPYVSYGAVLRVMAAGYLVGFVAEVGGALLRGLDRSRHAFLAEASRAIAVIVVAIPLIRVQGVMGASVGALVAGLVRLTVVAVFARRATRVESGTGPAEDAASRSRPADHAAGAPCGSRDALEVASAPRSNGNTLP